MVVETGTPTQKNNSNVSSKQRIPKLAFSFSPKVAQTNEGAKPRKRRAEVSCLLTGTPHKNELVQALGNKKRFRGRKTSLIKTTKLESKNDGRVKQNVKRKLPLDNFGRSIKQHSHLIRKRSKRKNARKKSNFSSESCCIYCKEICIEDDLKEDWLPCQKCGACGRLTHESCCPIEPGQRKKKCASFVCDFCLY